MGDSRGAGSPSGARKCTASPGLAIFDLDGTLVDSAPDLAAAVDATFARAGLPAPGEARLRAWIGDGARIMVERALAWAGAAGPSQSAPLYAEFVTEYAAHIATRTKPYPGIGAALDSLAAAGLKLAVVTNKSESLARKLLAQLGLDARFASIVGGDSLAEKKPAPAPLLAAARAAELAPGRAVMIGDSVADIRAARAAGMRALAVAWGYGDPVALAEAQAELLIARPADIPPALGVDRLALNLASGAR